MLWNSRKIGNTAKALIILAKDGIDFLKKMPNTTLNNKGQAEVLIFNSSFIGLRLAEKNPVLYNNTTVEYSCRLDKEMSKLCINTKADMYNKFLNNRIEEFTDNIKKFTKDPMSNSENLFIRFFVSPVDQYKSTKIKVDKLMNSQIVLSHTLKYIDEDLDIIIKHAESKMQ